MTESFFPSGSSHQSVPPARSRCSRRYLGDILADPRFRLAQITSEGNDGLCSFSLAPSFSVFRLVPLAGAGHATQQPLAIALRNLLSHSFRFLFWLFILPQPYARGTRQQDNR